MKYLELYFTQFITVILHQAIKNRKRLIFVMLDLDTRGRWLQLFLLSGLRHFAPRISNGMTDPSVALLMS